MTPSTDVTPSNELTVRHWNSRRPIVKAVGVEAPVLVVQPAQCHRPRPSRNGLRCLIALDHVRRTRQRRPAIPSRQGSRFRHDTSHRLRCSLPGLATTSAGAYVLGVRARSSRRAVPRRSPSAQMSATPVWRRSSTLRWPRWSGSRPRCSRPRCSRPRCSRPRCSRPRDVGVGVAAHPDRSGGDVGVLGVADAQMSGPDEDAVALDEVEVVGPVHRPVGPGADRVLVGMQPRFRQVPPSGGGRPRRTHPSYRILLVGRGARSPSPPGPAELAPASAG